MRTFQLDFDIMRDGLWLTSKESSKEGVKNLTLSGRRWRDISNRCMSGGAFQKLRPTYEGCFSTFTNFQRFVEWSRSIHGYDLKDDKGRKWQLDKDLILPGNKEYGENTCLFVPASVNNFLISTNKARGEYLLGVSKDCPSSRKFIAQCQTGVGKQMKVSGFTCEEDAHFAWQSMKLDVGFTLCKNLKSSGADLLCDILTKRLDALSSKLYNREICYGV